MMLARQIFKKSFLVRLAIIGIFYVLMQAVHPGTSKSNINQGLKPSTVETDSKSSQLKRFQSAQENVEQYSAVPTNIYTTFRCKNKKLVVNGQASNKEAHVCHFKNLCIKNGQFVAAFRKDGRDRPPFMFVTNKKYSSRRNVMTSPFLAEDNRDHRYGFTRRQGLEKEYGQGSIQIQAVDGPLKVAGNSEVVYHRELAAISSLYAAGNAGHMLWETFAPSFGAAEFLSVGSSGSMPRRVLFPQSCAHPDKDVLYEYPLRNCLYFTANYLGVVSDQAPYVVTEMNDGKTTCFSDVVLSNEWFNGFVHEDPISITVAHKSMRNYIYKRLNVTSQNGFQPKKSLTFLVQFKKSGRHGRMFQNATAVLEIVKQTIKKSQVPIELKVLDLENTSIQDQIRAIASADIYFTNGGSGFYLSNMLPDGAIVIAPAQCDIRQWVSEERRNILSHESSVNPQWYYRLEEPKDAFVECTPFEINMLNSLGYIDIYPIPIRPEDVQLSSNFYVQPHIVQETVMRAILVKSDSVTMVSDRYDQK
ncbi:hypothetical protein MP228_005750 [Amoeboaphelidium protococcarum]|nr:hypothetical protein MP228_005750 [Amoeboaphelidium protococcarum]